MLRHMLWPMTMALPTLWASSAWAQDEDLDTAPPDADVAAEGESLGAPEEDEAGEVVDAAGDTGDSELEADDIQQAVEPLHEFPDKTYYFVGARYRALIVPKFMMNLFGADGGTNVVVHSFGPEFGIRKDQFEYNLSIWYADYSMDPTPFKGSNDPDTAWEHVESEVSVIYLTADFMWTQPFSPEVGFNYGLGAGIGFPFGDLIRTEVYDNGGPVEDWPECEGPGDPNAAFCEEGTKNEPTWANGGSKPIVFPWLAAQIGLRFKPHRNFVARLDLGFGTSGFLLGVGADYGL